MMKLFISHSSQDDAFVRDLRAMLADHGQDVWIDSRELRGYVRMPFTHNRYYVQTDGIWRRSSPVVVGEIRLDTFVINSVFGYSATRWLRTEAYYAFTRQDSVITGGEVDRHRVGVQLVISQPMRIQ